MSANRVLVLGLLILGLAPAAAKGAAPAPSWSLQAMAAPTNFTPGDEGKDAAYEVAIVNNGAAVTDGSPIKLKYALPPGLAVKAVELRLRVGVNAADFGDRACTVETVGATSTVMCEVDEALPEATEPTRVFPGETIGMAVQVLVPPGLSGPLTSHAEVSGGGAESTERTVSNEASDKSAPSGFQYLRSELTDEAGKMLSGAGQHPYQYTTSFAINTELAPPGFLSPLAPSGGPVRNIDVALPPGLIGNPMAVQRCTPQQFNTVYGAPAGYTTQPTSKCPDGSAVGVVLIQQVEGKGGIVPVPLYNLVPPRGMPAQFGFQIVGAPIYIDTELRSGGDYGVNAKLRYASAAKRVTAASVVFWGTPGASDHDRLRARCLNTLGGVFSLGTCPAGIPNPQPFFRLPTSCEVAMTTAMTFDTWTQPGSLLQATDTAPPLTGCAEVPFEPAVAVRPSTEVADSPSGLHVQLHIPQPQDPDSPGEADLRDTTVSLPEGLVVNPSSADGLGACTAGQVGLLTTPGSVPPRFTARPAECPDNSKIGTVTVRTPLLGHPLPGAVYLATQGSNPFGSVLAIYITVHDPQSGVVVKLPAEVSADPVSGRLTATASASPQVPFEDFELDFFSGARAPLRTPQTCGVRSTGSVLVPWSAPEGAAAMVSDSFEITASPGGPCASSLAGLANAPSFEAGTLQPGAGSFSPLLVSLKRDDGSQELDGLNVKLAPGLLASLAGVGQCSESQISHARSREAPGQGIEEKESPSCPSGSRLGSVTVGAGAGPSPYHVKGDVYLAGPYKGAPLSVAIVTPALAGPFDLGTVVVRAALYVDPETAIATVKSDPIPRILQGIPLDIRSIAVRIDRDRFTINPTSCDPYSISAEGLSTSGQVAGLSSRFQVGGCSDLRFKPKFALRLGGGTKRGKHPALRATLTMPPGGANIAGAKVTLPHSAFLAQAHIRTICTRVQFAADTCPKGSIYGYASAVSPLLDDPLKGPVYLRSSNNPLPDLVADLRGQIRVVLVGSIDSKRARIRTTFASVPDAAVSRFVLSMYGGRKGLIENSRDLCHGVNRASTDFFAQNGKALRLRPVVKAKCRKGPKGKRGSRGKAGHKRVS